MKIVVDKKIKKFDEDVEDLIQTSEIVEECNGLRVIDTPEIVINGSYNIFVDSLKELHIESNYPIQIEIEKESNTIVNLLDKREFSFVGQDESLNITLTNNNTVETEKAKIKIVVVE